MTRPRCHRAASLPSATCAAASAGSGGSPPLVGIRTLVPDAAEPEHITTTAASRVHKICLVATGWRGHHCAAWWGAGGERGPYLLARSGWRHPAQRRVAAARAVSESPGKRGASPPPPTAAASPRTCGGPGAIRIRSPCRFGQTGSFPPSSSFAGSLPSPPVPPRSRYCAGRHRYCRAKA